MENGIHINNSIQNCCKTQRICKRNKKIIALILEKLTLLQLNKILVAEKADSVNIQLYFLRKMAGGMP